MKSRRELTISTFSVLFIMLSLCHISHAATPEPELRVKNKWNISFVNKEWDDPTGQLPSLYWQKGWSGVEKTAEKIGVNISHILKPRPKSTDVPYGRAHIELQIRAVNELITNGKTDGIVIAPVNSQQLVPVVEKAIAAGIPVVAVDTSVNTDKIVTYVVHDDFSGGKTMGEWVVSRLNRKAQVLVLSGPSDNQNAIDRLNGFLAGFKSGNLIVLDVRSGNWEETVSEDIVANWLEEHKTIDAIVALSDNMAVGAQRALIKKKRHGVMITGYGAYLLDSGKISGSLDNLPGEQCGLALRILIEHLETGKTFPPTVKLKTSVVRVPSEQ